MSEAAPEVNPLRRRCSHRRLIPLWWTIGVPRPSALTPRLDAAHRRAAVAKAGVTGVAVVAFAAALGLSRLYYAGHPKAPLQPLTAPPRYVQIVRQNLLQAGMVATEAPPGRRPRALDRRAPVPVDGVRDRRRGRKRGRAPPSESCSHAATGCSCFAADSELNLVNGRAGQPTLVSAEFAGMVELALTAAEQTGGLVDPTLGLCALEAAGYDRDFAPLGDDPRPPEAPAPSGLPVAPRRLGRASRSPAGVRLDLNGVVKAQTVDDAWRHAGRQRFRSAGGDLAARGASSVALPGGERRAPARGRAGHERSDRRRWRRAGRGPAPPDRPAQRPPARSPWEQVTVCARPACGADVAAKAAFLLGHDGPGLARRAWLPGRFRTADGAVAVNRRGSSRGESTRASDLEPGRLVRGPRRRGHRVRTAQLRGRARHDDGGQGDAAGGGRSSRSRRSTASRASSSARSSRSTS